MAKNSDPRFELDPTDIAMIEILQDDGRISVSELGRRVGLSQPAASERLKRLEERGIVSGYRAVIDPASVGLGMMAIIRTGIPFAMRGAGPSMTRAVSRIQRAECAKLARGRCPVIR